MQPTRRTALWQIAGAAAISALPIFGQNPPPENHHSVAPVTPEAATEYRFVFFRPEQMNTLEALTETIIPEDHHSPGARAARVAEYIDAIVADASDERKRMWTEGLGVMDRMAEAQYGRPYGKCAPEEQVAVMEHIATHEDHPQSPEEHFFVELKRATIDGYYTSRIGIHQELGYQGNTYVADFPGCGGGSGR